jgi:hypothetical protein
MRIVQITLATLVLCCAAARVTAQTTGELFDQAIECGPESAPRLDGIGGCDDLRPAEAEGDPVVIEYEVKLPPLFGGATVTTRQCKAQVNIGYFQDVTIAHVKGSVTNITCGASQGSVVFSVRTADAAGTQSTQEFLYTWMKDDDQPVEFEVGYPIGENVDLRRVRALRVQCTCAEAALAQP